MRCPEEIPRGQRLGHHQATNYVADNYRIPTRCTHEAPTHTHDTSNIVTGATTSFEEHTGDAWALLTEDGRGERRNVWGERLARDEPQES